jgi:hypothetical protein
VLNLVSYMTRGRILQFVYGNANGLGRQLKGIQSDDLAEPVNSSAGRFRGVSSLSDKAGDLYLNDSAEAVCTVGAMLAWRTRPQLRFAMQA